MAEQTEQTSAPERTETEQQYIDAVVAFVTLERSRDAVQEQIHTVTSDLREAFGDDKVAAVTFEETLVRAAIEQTGITDDKVAEAVLRAAGDMVKVEEAVAAGLSRGEAQFAIMLGLDPTDPSLGRDGGDDGLGGLGPAGGRGPLEF